MSWLPLVWYTKYVGVGTFVADSQSPSPGSSSYSKRFALVMHTIGDHLFSPLLFALINNIERTLAEQGIQLIICRLMETLNWKKSIFMS